MYAQRTYFSSLDQCCYCCCGCSLAIASQADQNGVVLKISEFLALLAIESHRTAAQHIEVACSKGNSSQTFANIVAVDHACFFCFIRIKKKCEWNEVET